MSYYRIADLTVQMDTFGMTAQRAEKYRCTEPKQVDIILVSSWPQNKAKHPEFDDNSGEYISTGFEFYRHLLQFDGMMLHSSAVVVDGKAYLFTADSGTGKSTHANLWLRLFGDRAYILNDDKPALRRIDGRWYAYGTPWSGKHDISENVGVPVAGIAMVNRADENAIEPCRGKDAIPRLFKQLNRPRAAECRVQLLHLLDKLLQEVPVWQLYCNMDQQAAQVAYTAMSGKEQE